MDNAAVSRGRTVDGSSGEGVRRVRKEKRFKLFSIRAGIDMPFLTLVLVLLGIGLVMMFMPPHSSLRIKPEDNVKKIDMNS